MASDAYIKIGDIKGESTDSNHSDWIEIESFQSGLAQMGGGGGSGTGFQTAGRVDISDLTFTKEMDKATPKLIEACCKATPIPKVEIHFVAAADNPHQYMKYELKDAIVSSVSHSAAMGGGQRPSESFSLRFSEIKWEYTGVDDAGKAETPIRTGWSLKNNKLVS